MGIEEVLFIIVAVAFIGGKGLLTQAIIGQHVKDNSELVQWTRCRRTHGAKGNAYWH